MQIVFFSQNKDLLELSAILPEGKFHFWFGVNSPVLNANSRSPGVLFIDFDDPSFNLEEFQQIIQENQILNDYYLKVLISSELSVKAFKKLQDENKFIDSLLRAPIKLKDIETFVEDYKLVLSESGAEMSGLKKQNFEDPINRKIQSKFDLIYAQLNDNLENDDFLMNKESTMTDNTHKKEVQEKGTLKLDLDEDVSGIEFESATAAASSPKVSAKPTPKEEGSSKLALLPDDNDLEFTLDFGDDADEEIVTNKATTHVPIQALSEQETIPSIPSFEYSENDSELDAMFDAAIVESSNQVSEGTQKTIVFDRSKLSEPDSFKLENSATPENSLDLLSELEAHSNIESTINDILRPDVSDSTQEFNISEMQGAEELESFSLENKASSAGEFDLGSIDFDEVEISNEIVDEVVIPKSSLQATDEVHNIDDVQDFEDFDLNESDTSSTFISTPPSQIDNVSVAIRSTANEEDTSRVQATIRQLREEREELLTQIKNLKSNSRELEQDNLTLKAYLDESKIEVSILRKRHLLELEEIKYQFSINEEKKLQAIEKARQAEGKREKLEQRVRIDFNQVKQREKELETKLEMLTIDIDSQVQSRDQKILELRRKIDSLEFNMENVSIKEHKSQDDKRKLEDKLNKIMKTLRHSIKNLEDDIDEAGDDSQEVRPNTSSRSGKA